MDHGPPGAGIQQQPTPQQCGGRRGRRDGDAHEGQHPHPFQLSDQQRDPAAREISLQRAEQILLDDCAVVPVFFGVARNLVSPQVKGWIDNNVNIHRTRYLSLNRAIRTV